MNVIAGLLIGWLNDEWLLRLTIPLIWGAVWCVYNWLVRADRTFETTHSSQKPAWGLSNRGAFYLIEFNTAATTSLAFSLVAGALRTLLKD